MYAEIAINANVNTAFDYHIPPELLGKLEPGHLVQVPFRTGMQYGIVLAVRDTSVVNRTKPVSARLDPRPALTPEQIDLARWLSATYLASIGLCLWLLLPPGITSGRDIQVRLLREDAITADEVEAELVALLKRRGPLRGHQINLALPGKPWRAAVDALAKQGVVERDPILMTPHEPRKKIETVALAIHPDEIESVLPGIARVSRRADVLELVVSFNGTLMRTPANRAQVDKLAEAGLVTVAADQTVALAISAADVPEKLLEMRKLDKPRRILRLLARESEPIDVGWVYAHADVTLADLKRLAEEGVVVLGEKHNWRDSLAERDFVPAEPPSLTPEQQAAWDVVRTYLMPSPPDPLSLMARGEKNPQYHHATFLLHGVTGSGKTEIYLRAIELTLQQGRSAMFLVPEIALTAQTVRRVSARFAGRVAVVHSGLSEIERYNTWRRAKEGLVQVIVGARSALFTPLPNIGLIVLDEEHDSSYKQSPPIPPPHYHARQVAEEMMRRAGGVLIVGSATPDLDTAYRAKRGEIHLLKMPNRVMGHRARIMEQAEREGVVARYEPGSAEDALMIELPPVKLVDMRRELKAGNTSIFSRALQAGLTEVLRKQEQAILFMNRRGQSTYVFCRDCGYVAACPRCDTPLTHHRMGQSLRCHRCGYEQPEPQICPQCKSNRIKFFGAGTQQVEQALHQMFPEARTLRWDADTASSAADHESILHRFSERRADILVGTQMVAKGLDLPLVTLVGVVSADLGLAMPDFRANERTFQLLTQVAGRAGRGLLGGQVILQTYQPEHYAVAAAAGHDYETFYERELAYRRDMGYPPLRRLVRVLFQFNSETKAQAEAERAAELFRQKIRTLQLTGTDLIGPAPCFFTRINTVYRWHLLLRGPDPTAALRDLDIPSGWFVDVDPVEVL